MFPGVDNRLSTKREAMSVNTFGRLLRFTTWGESHGPALGAVVDGCPPGLEIERRRDPAVPRRAAPRPVESSPPSGRNPTGAHPVGRVRGAHHRHADQLMIENVDQRSKDYSEVAKAYRPGHADYAYDAKYGFRDYRGGGRSSARETAARVAAGAVARLVIPEVAMLGYVSEIGGDAIDMANFDAAEIGNNPFFCPDAAAAKRWEKIVDDARLAGSSVGAVVECVATGRSARLGRTALWQARCRSCRRR
jgi:chorismate synthase